MDGYLSSALGVPLKDGRLQDIDEAKYVLTLDYTVKVCVCVCACVCTCMFVRVCMHTCVAMCAVTKCTNREFVMSLRADVEYP